MQPGAVGFSGEAKAETREARVSAATRIGSEWYFGLGVARCRPDDRFNEKVGSGIALGRALQDLGKRIEEKWLERSACEKDVLARRGKAELSEAEIQEQVDQGYLEYVAHIRGVGNVNLLLTPIDQST